MIRFACPGCGAVNTAEDSAAGSTASCAKCRARFVVPAASPKPAAGAPVEIKPCPGCGAKLSVQPGDLGNDVECPYCKAVYKAAKPGGGDGGSRWAREEEPRPSKRRAVRDEADDEDDDDRPRRRRRRDDDEEDDYDDRPSRRRRRDDEESKRITAGVFALLLGGWGVHKFYLGYSTAGIIQIALTLFTCGIGAFVPLIEGIIYLTKTDREFIRTYQRGTKEWF